MKTIFLKYLVLFLLICSLCACSSCFKIDAPAKFYTMIVPYKYFDMLYRYQVTPYKSSITEVFIRNCSNTPIAVTVLRKRRTFKDVEPLYLDSVYLEVDEKQPVNIQSASSLIYFKVLHSGIYTYQVSKEVQVPTYDGE